MHQSMSRTRHDQCCAAVQPTACPVLACQLQDAEHQPNAIGMRGSKNARRTVRHCCANPCLRWVRGHMTCSWHVCTVRYHCCAALLAQLIPTSGHSSCEAGSVPGWQIPRQTQVPQRDSLCGARAQCPSPQLHTHRPLSKQDKHSARQHVLYGPRGSVFWALRAL